ncbi:MAG: hypothetical protein HZB26_00395 [Candidatus Hydrogenedentes bacterium]|nr:hypothetical protein [Candidatus Hydrogenedentota bacterium]
MNTHIGYSILTTIGILLACMWTPFSPAAEETGPDIVPVAVANNPQPKELPSIRVVKEKLWGQYYPMVAMSFPNVPDFQCDAWCYESEVELVDAKPLEGGAVEMRHRDRQSPQALVITVIRPKPGSIEFEARVELDTKDHAGATLPAPPGLNLCWQLRHAPGFASKPDPYPEFVKRCFIFTDRGRTFLLDTDRTKIPVQTSDHEYNNPPWVQSYVSAAKLVPVTPAGRHVAGVARLRAQQSEMAAGERASHRATVAIVRIRDGEQSESTDGTGREGFPEREASRRDGGGETRGARWLESSGDALRLGRNRIQGHLDEEPSAGAVRTPQGWQPSRCGRVAGYRKP